MSVRKPLTASLFVLLAIFTLAPLRSRASADHPAVAPEDLLLKDNPAEPGAAAMILYREEIVNNKDFHDFYSEHFYRIKIFTDAGKKYADIELATTKVREVRDIKGRTIHPDGKIVEFDGKVLDKLLVKAGDVKVQVKAFSLPDVTPGSIIEYSYKVQLPGSVFAYADWPVQDAMYTKRAHFVYTPYAAGTTASLLWRAMHLENIKPPHKESDGSWALDVADVPGLPEEDYMLPLNEVRGRIEFYYTSERHTADAKEYWDRIAKMYADEYEKFIGKRNSIRDVVQQVTASADSPEAKLRKLYARAQAIHNLDYDPEKTAQEQERDKEKKDLNVEDVLKRGSGTGVNIDQFFVALAQAAGFEAGLSWVRGRNNSFSHPELQDRFELNDSLVWVHAGDKDYYLHPGNPFCPFGMLPWYETFTTSMRPTKLGAIFAETPLPPSAQTTLNRTAQFTLDPDGTLSGTITVRFTGQRAFLRRMDSRNQDEAGRKKVITDEIKAWFPASTTFELTSLSGWDKNDEPLEAQGKVTMPNIATVAGKRVLVQLSAYTGSTRQLFESTKRKQDIYFAYPFATADDFTIQLPANLQTTSLPKPTVYNLGAEFHYDITAKQEGNALHILRKINVNGVLYPVDSYGDIRGFYSLAKAGDEQQMVLQSSSSGN